MLDRLIEADSNPKADRLGPLRAAKLRALVSGHWGQAAESEAAAGLFPGGATLLQGGTRRAWVLIDDGDYTALGPALIWAQRHEVRVFDVLVDDARTGSGIGASPDSAVMTAPTSGFVARRAQQWSDPPTTWRVAGQSLHVALPAPSPAPIEPPAEAMAFADVLAAHGADPVVEDGRLVGEVLGLEVARVVPHGGGWSLEVGVGRLDRDARAEMRPDEPDGEGIDEVVAVVRTWRRPGAARHPANTLARERWLRAVVVANPSLVGAKALTPIPSPWPRRGLRQGAAAPAAGLDADGRQLVVKCSTGVDVDLIPAAADVRYIRAEGRPADGRLIVVVPEGDDYPVTRSLAASLRHPAEVRTVRRDWAALSERD
jgi:hypothetical protein